MFRCIKRNVSLRYFFYSHKTYFRNVYLRRVFYVPKIYVYLENDADNIILGVVYTYKSRE